jgi:hypothetical protein
MKFASQKSIQVRVRLTRIRDFLLTATSSNLQVPTWHSHELAVVPNYCLKMDFRPNQNSIRSVAAKLERHQRQLFSHFGQTGYPKVLALQQIITRFADQFADGIELQSNHALPRPNR